MEQPIYLLCYLKLIYNWQLFILVNYSNHNHDAQLFSWIVFVFWIGELTQSDTFPITQLAFLISWQMTFWCLEMWKFFNLNCKCMRFGKSSTKTKSVSSNSTKDKSFKNYLQGCQNFKISVTGWESHGSSYKP